MTLNLELPTPKDFPAFPFNPPYQIQVELMRHLYECIEQRKITIVESPTGTGKTLSLLCASLTWLKDERERAKKGKLYSATDDGTNAKDWVIEQTRGRVRRELEAEETEYRMRLAKARKREELMKKMAKARVTKRPKQSIEATVQSDEANDEQFLPEDESYGEEDMNVSPALRALMDKVDKASKLGFDGEAAEPTCTKIYYASRTHSQLTQVLPELSRLNLDLQVKSCHPLADEPTDIGSTRKRHADSLDADAHFTPHTRTVALGSRRHLCINDELRAKSRDVDEGCRALLSEKGDKRCQFLPLPGDEHRMMEFRDQILATPKDIEELAAAGRQSQICPYFGARRTIPQAEVVTLPYNLLLQQSARESLGIDLTNQIVIIDEAHNLIPTLLSLSTSRLPYTTLATSFMQVCAYVSKFKNRLNPNNLLHLKRLVVFLDALKKYVLEWKASRTSRLLKESQAQPPSAGNLEIMTAAELIDRLGRKTSGINLLEIEKYLRSSKVARKIASYSDKEAERQGDGSTPRRGELPPLHFVETFLVSLSGATDDGRVTFSLVGAAGNETVELKYQLLNPSPPFQDVATAARSVILAGGTMAPVSDVISQLFSYVSPERLATHSCGHIIPAGNLSAVVVTKGPHGGELEYKVNKQKDSAAISELGQTLMNFCRIVPAGMVVFFPSYSFLNSAKALWQKTGMLDKFSVKKKTFFEPADTMDVDKVLQEYAASVHVRADKITGAILFAVVGAKLSEGLNFADDLARAVVIIGLPYANLGSPELRERMQYVNRLEKALPGRRNPQHKDAATELYENMCMNAVNQSIGRAIRHRGDWASLIFLDCRYASHSVRNKLPKWIGDGLTISDGFGQAVKSLGSFYQNKKCPHESNSLAQQ